MSSHSVVRGRRVSDDLTPLEAFFWRPRFIAECPELEHVPLLFWLTANVDIRRLAVIGVGNGVTHFALCQGVAELGSGGTCVGYGYWEDRKSGKRMGSAPATLRDRESMLYQTTSKLVAGDDPRKDVERQAARPLDLLLVDFAALPPHAALEARLLEDAVAENGLLVLLGANKLSAPPGSLGGRLGFSTEYPLIDLGGKSEGVLLLKGERTSRALEAVLDSAQEGRFKRSTACLLRRSGEGLMASARVVALDRGRAKAEAELAALQTELSAVRESLLALKTRDGVLARKVIELQQEVFELHQERSSIERIQAEAFQIHEDNGRARLQELRVERDTLQERLEDYRATVELLTSERDESRAIAEERHAELERKRAQHLEELTVLTRVSEEWRARVKEHRHDLSLLRTQFEDLRLERDAALAKVRQQRETRQQITSDLKSDIRALRRDVQSAERDATDWKRKSEVLEREVRDLRGSTSWRITRPLRTIRRILSANRRPEA